MQNAILHLPVSSSKITTKISKKERKLINGNNNNNNNNNNGNSNRNNSTVTARAVSSRTNEKK
jgi:hypothetical protein